MSIAVTNIQQNKLIVALDFPLAAAADKLIVALGDDVSFYKIGLQLFIAEGPTLVRRVANLGKNVFLDLKLHDIPNTVASAIESIAPLEVRMLTVHAAGGSTMLRAAVDAAASLPSRPTVLAVTVLTSLGDDDLAEIGVAETAQKQAVRLARMAKSAGCGGLVASPHEVRDIRTAIGREMTIVTPGVRPRGASAGDQRRVATPEDAIQAGADYIVVGRPITAAPDPLAAARAILAEMNEQSKSRP